MAVPPGPPTPVMPEQMSKGVGRSITLTTFFLIPALALLIVGWYFGRWYLAGEITILWIGPLYAMSQKFHRVRTFMVVERFGLIWDVKFSGPRLRIPFIDTTVMLDDFLQKQVELFLKDGGPERFAIDFKEGAAPIISAAWYQIANPVDVEGGIWGAVRNQVLRYTYRVKAEERASRIAEIFQGAFRGVLERKSATEQRTFVEAEAEMEELARQGTVASGAALEEIGVYPFPQKGIIVRDVDVPEEIVKLREKVLAGEMEAQEAINRYRSFHEPLRQMKRGLTEGDGGMTLSDAQILQFFLAQRGFETLQKTGSNVSLVAADIDGVLRTITVGSTNQPPRSGPTGGGTP